MGDDLIPTLIPRDGRDETGRFVTGNRAARGNRGRAKMQELRDALLEAGTPARVLEVEAAVREMAIGGDVSAAKLWWSYMVGMPVQAVEVSTPDGGNLNLATVLTTILVALGDDEAARVKVAAAFHKLGRRHQEGNGHAVGDGPGAGA
jgi:hypothetical protein